MKRFWIGLTTLVWLISACTPAVTSGPTAAHPTSNRSLLPTESLFPTSTATSSITPLPTIPTFTPTFDARTIVTVTPAPKAECPKEDLNLKPDLKVLFAQEGLRLLKDKALLEFLNSGGTPQEIIAAFLREYKWFHSDMGIQQDITGDGVAEFILTDGYVVYVFGCKNKQYQTLISDTDDLDWMQAIHFHIVKDMNLNGIPELIDIEYGGHTYTSIKVSIFEWNGQEFLPLIQGKSYGNKQYFTFADTSVPAHVTIHDIDGDGILDLVLESDLPIPISSLYDYLMPWRNENDIYVWNGTYYVLNRIEYTSPEFRFQAIQDADRQISYGNFDKALLLYQDVISSKKLKPFSSEIADNERAKSFAVDENQPTPTSVVPDLSEYPRLAAYAYYRIMLLHLIQNHEPEAMTVYNTLQQKFGTDQYGHPYVEMASAFWEAYQSTHKMYDGCAAAIQYAAEHPEILIPLGSDYHGSQSHIYVPEDVCPFR